MNEHETDCDCPNCTANEHLERIFARHDEFVAACAASDVAAMDAHIAANLRDYAVIAAARLEGC
jgi:hypothetical protein